MSPAERQAALAARESRHFPWHSPPHLDLAEERVYILTATCYEHQPVIGHSPQRMAECQKSILDICAEWSQTIFAWCILPTHYHLLFQTEKIWELRRELGLWHGRSSRGWNLEEHKIGRKVWFNCFERPLKSEGHFYASLNYIHHNPVKHGLVKQWLDWPFSSAQLYLECVGRKEAERVWRQYPVLNYGKKWDI